MAITHIKIIRKIWMMEKFIHYSAIPLIYTTYVAAVGIVAPKGMGTKQSTKHKLEENQYYYSEDPI